VIRTSTQSKQGGIYGDFLTPDANGTNQMHCNKDEHFAFRIQATKFIKRDFAAKNKVSVFIQFRRERSTRYTKNTLLHLLGNKSKEFTRFEVLLGPLKEGVGFLQIAFIVCRFKHLFQQRFCNLSEMRKSGGGSFATCEGRDAGKEETVVEMSLYKPRLELRCSDRRKGGGEVR
jgi:hypothetical protein